MVMSDGGEETNVWWDIRQMVMMCVSDECLYRYKEVVRYTEVASRGDRNIALWIVLLVGW